MISRDRHEEAQIVLKRLRDSHEDPLLWQKEYLQISAQLAVEAEEKKAHSWSHLITDKSERKRVLIAIAALTSLQTNGAQTIQVYQASFGSVRTKYSTNSMQSVLYTGLGFSLRSTLLLSGVFQIILSIGCIMNMVLIDRLGRRKLFMGGFVILSICLGIFAACTAMYESTGRTSMSLLEKFRPLTDFSNLSIQAGVMAASLYSCFLYFSLVPSPARHTRMRPRCCQPRSVLVDSQSAYSFQMP